MKIFKTILLVILSIIAGIANGQTDPVSFSYDDNGNRIHRAIIVQKSMIVQFPTTELSLDQNLIPPEPVGDMTIKIYPNPTRGILKLEIQNIASEETPTYMIFDLNGTLHISKKLVSPETNIDISHLKDGLYILRIIIGKDISDWKIIKSRYL